MIRFALHGKFDLFSTAITIACAALFLAIAIYGYDPGRGFMQAKRGGGPA